MDEVELRDYFKIILKRKKIIIFTVIIFSIVSFIMNHYIKNYYTTKAKLLLTNYHPQGIAISLELYKGYSVALQVKEELKLDSLPPTPDLEVIENSILEISISHFNPEDTVKICNVWLSKIENQEKQKYEEGKKYYQKKIESIEAEMLVLKEERDKTIARIEDIINIIRGLKIESAQELSTLFSQGVYFQRVGQVETKLDSLKSELKNYKEKLTLLMAPEIIMPSLSTQYIIGPKKGGILLGSFMGLVIGIGLAFLIEYIKM